MPQNPSMHAAVSRRTLVQAAWAAPVIATAVAAPLAAASPGVPSITLNVFALDENYAWGTVIFSRDGVTDLTQAFEFQGTPPSEWENIYTGQSTNSSGYYASTLPRIVIGTYDQIPVSAFVAGYGLILSNSVSVQDLWP